MGQRVVAFGDACINTRCANVLPNNNAETARPERSFARGSAGCARQRHGMVDGKRSAQQAGLPSETSALPGRTISGATWKRRVRKLAVPTLIRKARSDALAVQALWETLRRPSGAGTHRASFAAAFMRPAVGPQGSYLVDPASSHMLVSKIKPCMSKYKLLYTVKLRMAH